MSHSTHSGFRLPPTAVLKFSPPDIPEQPGPPIPSERVGVGHIRITAPTRLSLFAWLGGRLAFFESLTVGVGNKEDAAPEVWGAKGGCGYTLPLRIKPEFGQVPENSAEVPSSLRTKQPCNIFSHDPPGPSAANDSDVLSPQVALVL